MQRRALISWLTASSSAAAVPVRAAPAGLPPDGVIDVRAFGATGDGRTDDTRAIQAAIDQAQVPLSTQYWGDIVRRVHLPAGQYRVSGLDIGARIAFTGEGPGQTVLVQIGGCARSILRVLPDRRQDGTAALQQPTLQGFTIAGYATGPCGNSHGIEFTDQPLPLGKVYSVAARIVDVNVIGCRDDGIRVGRNRNFGFLERVTILHCNANALTMAGSFDWRISNTSLGSSGRHGLHLLTGGALALNGCNIYSNAGEGVRLEAGVGAYVYLTGGAIDGNGGNGIYADGSDYGEPTSFHLAVNHTRFSVNGLTGGSHLLLKDCAHVAVSGCMFWRPANERRNAGYLVETTGRTGQVSFVGNAYATDPALRPFAVAAFSQPDRIQGATLR